MNNSKDKEKEVNTKKNNKAPPYKLPFDIESLIDINDILEERILDANIEFILKIVFDIVKKDSYELIIDIIKKKKQMIYEIVMARILDTLIEIRLNYF